MPSNQVIGFDLGGTKSAVGVYEAGTWKELHHETLPTHASQGWETVFANTVTVLERLRTKDTSAVGIGVPGLLQQPQGHLLNAPNIPGASDVALRSLLEKKLGLPVFVENDARCFTLAESMLGAGKEHSVVIGVTMGTGVGGGIVVNGKVMHGAHGFAGEIGHMLLMPGQPPYPTDDTRGDAEQFFSGTAMGKRCEAAKKPEEYLDGQACTFLHPHLFREIAWMLTSLTYLLDPSIIVFGGSAGMALKPHLQNIRDELQQWLLPNTPMPELAIGKLEHAGAIGAALLTQKS